MNTKDFIRAFFDQFHKNMEPWPVFRKDDCETLEQLAQHSVLQVARKHDQEILSIGATAEADSETEITVYVTIRRRLGNGQFKALDLMIEVSDVSQELVSQDDVAVMP